MINNAKPEKSLIPFFQVDAFSDGPFTGNPAAVCLLEDWHSDATLQSIAKENNLSETAFLKKEQDGYSLRWFTPAVEVELCGHATLAAAYVIFEHYQYPGSKISFHTRSGVLTVRQVDDTLVMDFPAVKPKYIKTPENLISALGLNPDVVESVLEASDVVVVIKEEAELDSLNPDLNALAKFKTRGVVVTAPSLTYDFHSRWFGPQVGVNEDPVTGSAYTFLGLYWSERLGKMRLSAAQGGERKGFLNCAMEDNGRIALSGKACLIIDGMFHI
ncbi:PhzF family phenazine biosynthesis protein [Salmonella enterica]|nr:PhzF family phenazine biosynthesis protein [Salmonella enterica]EBA5087712.1 PhzF family phenazine biosynthesis protein [Salmonella enterica]